VNVLIQFSPVCRP